jgi:hypothetical protein
MCHEGKTISLLKGRKNRERAERLVCLMYQPRNVRTITRGRVFRRGRSSSRAVLGPSVASVVAYSHDYPERRAVSHRTTEDPRISETRAFKLGGSFRVQLDPSALIKISGSDIFHLQSLLSIRYWPE